MERAHRSTAAAGVAALVGAEAVAVAFLLRLGRVAGFALPARDPASWLRSASTETLVAVTGRAVALALTSWLLLATVLSLARRLLPLGRAGPALDLATPRSLRRLLDRLVVAALGASLAIGAVRPAGAVTSTSRVGGTVVATAIETPVRRVPPVPSAPAPVDVARPRPTSPARAAPSGTVEVRSGDNLWLIARRALGTERPSVVAPYWRRLIAANVDTLRSHDPNLIFPGERLVLPPVPAPEVPPSG